MKNRQDAKGRATGLRAALACAIDDGRVKAFFSLLTMAALVAYLWLTYGGDVPPPGAIRL
jgi:hypothetical protein